MFEEVYAGPVLTATQATYTIDPGEMIPAGSTLIAVISINAVDATINAPDGTWTKVQEGQSGGGITAAVFVKSVSANETITYTFTNSLGASKSYQGGIARYTLIHPTSPVHLSSKFDATATSSTSIDLPALGSSTTVDGCTIVRVGAITNGTTTATITMPATERGEWISGSTIAKRPAALSDSPQSVAGSVAADTAATTAATTTSRVGFTIALAPEPLETLRPTSINNLSNMTGAVTDIDEDPDVSNGADPLIATDPAGSPTTHGAQDPNTQALWTGSTAHTWTNPSNVFDTNDTTIASYALAANSTDYMDMWFFDAADFTGIPSDAIITGVSIASRWRNNGTANRLTAWVQLATANGTLLGNEQAVNAGASPSTTLTTYTNSHSGTMPTRAQLVTGTFGVRTRIRRSNTVTAELARITVTVTYAVPQTINTSVRILMGDPTGTLAIGATSGEIRMAVNRKGTPVSGNPTARAELHENGSATNLATVIPETSVTSGASAVLSGTFNQNLITNKNNVEVWFFGTGVAGATVELDAVEWNAAISSAQNISKTVTDTLGLTDAPAMVRGIARSITDALGITDSQSMAKGYARSITDTLGITDSATKLIIKERFITDTIGITDSQGTSIGRGRTITDSLGITDNTALARAYTKSVTDALGITDNRTLVRQVARTVNDTLGITDSSSYLLTKNKTVTDTIGITDSSTLTKTMQRSVTDSLGISDTNAIAKTIQRSVMDTLGITDNRTVGRDLGRTITDSLGITDNTSTLKTVVRSVTDYIGITDSHVRSVGRTKSVTDTLGITDSATKQLMIVITKVVTDSLAITDSRTTQRNISRSVNDSVGITDNRVIVRNLVRAITDSLGITDSQVETMSISRAIQDSLGITDNTVPIKTSFIQRTITDNIGITDTANANVFRLIARTITDTLGITDSRVTALNRNIVRTDALGIADAVTKAQALNRTLTDEMTIEDTVNQVMNRNLVLTDAITLTDSQDKVLAKFVEITDTLSLSDDTQYRIIAFTIAPFTTVELIAIPSATVEMLGIPGAVAELLGIPAADVKLEE